MKRLFSRLYRVLTTFLLHSKTIKGRGVRIAMSKIGRYGIEFYRNCHIVKSIVGNNVVIFENSSIFDSNLKGFNKIGKDCNISNSSLGVFSYIADNGRINNADIGKYCSIGLNLIVGQGKHPTTFISTSPVFYSSSGVAGKSFTKSSLGLFEEYQRIKIGNDVWIGANVIILDGVEIGDGAIIGAGSLVTKSVAEYSIVGGVPAKLIKFRYDPEIIKKVKNSLWWDKDNKWLNENIRFFQKPVNFMSDLDEFETS